jgi:hypothetical protein
MFWVFWETGWLRKIALLIDLIYRATVRSPAWLTNGILFYISFLKKNTKLACWPNLQFVLCCIKNNSEVLVVGENNNLLPRVNFRSQLSRIRLVATSNSIKMWDNYTTGP